MMPMSGHFSFVYLCADLHIADRGYDREFNLVTRIGVRAERWFGEGLP
jgi:hypothetical protein